MAIVLHVSPMNHASQNCSVFLHARTFSPEARRPIMRYQSDHGFCVTGVLTNSEQMTEGEIHRARHSDYGGAAGSNFAGVTTSDTFSEKNETND